MNAKKTEKCPYSRSLRVTLINCHHYTKALHSFVCYLHINVYIYVSYSWLNGWTKLAEIYFKEPMGAHRVLLYRYKQNFEVFGILRACNPGISS